MQMRSYDPFVPQPHVSSPYWKSYNAYQAMDKWWCRTLQIQGMNSMGWAGEHFIRTKYNVKAFPCGIKLRCEQSFCDHLRNLPLDQKKVMKEALWEQAIESNRDACRDEGYNERT